MVQLNPALSAFIDSLGEGKVWGQIWVQPTETGFLLHHVTDREASLEKLRHVSILELRKIGALTVAGQFRPLRASPDLSSGWVCACKTPEELGRAVQEIYPGSVADWFAARHSQPPVTHYREFTNRQSGMYRITQLLTDDQVSHVVRACCHPRFCLKRRLWSNQGLELDRVEAKSAIPCLEPCAILLELARKATRIEQEEKSDVELSRSELESLLEAAEGLLSLEGSGKRIGNLADPANPRRLQLLLEKLKGKVDRSPKSEEK